MTIIDLYSKRKRDAERGDQPEIYQYTNLPIQFRRQVVHMWISAIGKYDKNYCLQPLELNLWQEIHDLLVRELGLFDLPSNTSDPNPFEKCKFFLLNEETLIDNVLDLIELTFKYVEQIIPNLWYEYQNRGIKLIQTADQAISELNHRFREHGIGYQYSNGQIIRIDSCFLHSETVVPALTLISSEGFSGAEQEFRSAHEYFRRQEYKPALIEACKAFESTMKTICDKLGWTYDKERDTAAKLIQILRREELIPSYLDNHFSGLKQVLEAGVPTVRNKEAGHGQGSDTKEVPEYLAAYVLHLTASNIVLLVEAYKAKSGEAK